MTLKDIKRCFYYISIGDNTGRKLVVFEAQWDRMNRRLDDAGVTPKRKP